MSLRARILEPTNLLAAVFVVVAGLAVLDARAMPDTAGHYPSLVAGLLGVSAVVVIVTGLRNPRPAPADDPVDEADGEGGQATLRQAGYRFLLLLGVAVLVAALGLLYGGILAAAGFVLLGPAGPHRVRHALYASVGVLLLYGMLYGLGASLPTGLLLGGDA